MMKWIETMKLSTYEAWREERQVAKERRTSTETPVLSSGELFSVGVA
jgi:hypothetical protein